MADDQANECDKLGRTRLAAEAKSEYGIAIRCQKGRASSIRWLEQNPDNYTTTEHYRLDNRARQRRQGIGAADKKHDWQQTWNETHADQIRANARDSSKRLREEVKMSAALESDGEGDDDDECDDSDSSSIYDVPAHERFDDRRRDGPRPGARRWFKAGCYVDSAAALDSPSSSSSFPAHAPTVLPLPCHGLGTDSPPSSSWRSHDGDDLSIYDGPVSSARVDTRHRIPVWL